jgi:hypothetical protein
VEPSEERRDRPVGGLIAQTASEKLAERLLDRVAALALEEIRERPCASPPREARPPQHIADVARDPERRVTQGGDETRVGPQERAGGTRWDHRETEVTAERHPPGLPRRERIRAGLQREVADRDGRRDHPAVRDRLLEHDGLGARLPQPERRREPGDPAADHGDAEAHDAGTRAR